MKILLDANLSWRIVKKLAAHYSEVVHVDNCGSAVPASSEGIREENRSLVTILESKCKKPLVLMAKGFSMSTIGLSTAQVK